MHHLLRPSLFLNILFASTSASPLVKKGETATVNRQLAVGSGPRDFMKAKNRACLRYSLGCEVGEDELIEVSQHTATNTAPVAQVNNKLAAGKGTGSGEVVATPVVHDSEYLCPVTIGGQTLQINIDTGSSDLWIFNSGMRASDQKDRTVYDPSKSKTYKDIPGSTFSINYGDSSQSYGKVGVDTVEIGGLSVVAQAVELPTAVSSSFTADVNAEGILGLAFQSANSIQPESQPTFFENIKSNLKDAVFTANLKAKTAGSYEFGVIDHSSYVGDTIHYTPVDNSRGLWQFATKPGSSTGVADTGSSLLLLDDDIVNAYYAQVPGNSSVSQGITFPCDAKLPDFHIELGESYAATIAGSLINYAPALGQPGYCFGGIQSNNGQGVNIFGDIMFKSQFVVFDAGNMQIGFAPAA